MFAVTRHGHAEFESAARNKTIGQCLAGAGIARYFDLYQWCMSNVGIHSFVLA
jgi:hypothetical protein